MAWWSIFIVIVCVVFVFTLGIALGASTERRAWLLRAMKPDTLVGGPHCVDGEFYYIIPEKTFHRVYMMRPEGQWPTDHEHYQ